MGSGYDTSDGIVEGKIVVFVEALRRLGCNVERLGLLVLRCKPGLVRESRSSSGRAVDSMLCSHVSMKDQSVDRGEKLSVPVRLEPGRVV